MFTAKKMLAYLLSCGFLGCTALMHTESVSGTCAVEQEGCKSEGCKGQIDQVNCIKECEFEGRMCERRQGRVGDVREGGSSEKAFLVDLYSKKIRHSQAVEVSQGGTITPIKNAHALAPGAFLKVKVTFPPSVENAELVLRHGPGQPQGFGKGGPCYLTVSVGKKSLLGRYVMPPGMRAESFNLGKLLALNEDTPQTVEVVLFNNGAAGSKVPYLLSGLEIFYYAKDPPAQRSPSRW